jgi:triacylglycerol esterase/lipase EstA (alpha/beta hydrolase family)
MVKAGIGKKPVILVAYSMGGVVTRHLLMGTIMANKERPEYQGFIKNLKGVAFIASPLHGSTLRE